VTALEVAARDRLREIELDIELDVAPGRTVAVVGPSGAGKTTLLRVVAGLHRPASGRVVAGGETWLDTAAGADLPPDLRGCGFLFQDYALFPHLSAWRNVAFGLDGPRRERRARALAELGRFGIRDLADARPGALSGGERQRVALARSLVRDPPVLLLDEPLAALDPQTRREATEALAITLREAGSPSLLVTHSFDETVGLAQEACVLRRGGVAQRAAPRELAERPASGFVAALTGAIVLPGQVLGTDTEGTIVALDGGGTVRSPDVGSGRVAVSLRPWQVSLAPPAANGDPALNRVPGEVASAVEIGGRVNVTLAAPPGLRAELDAAAAADVELRPGARVVAAWQPAVTRLTPE
jgi:molybdate transport system ATP-binding protein